MDYFGNDKRSEPDYRRLRRIPSEQGQANIERDRVEFYCGDWKEVLERGPFCFIFADAADAKRDNPDKLFGALEAGGMLVMDDFTPEPYWPEDWKGKPDRVRHYWLNHPQLAATEILVTPREAVIIASKLSDEDI
ncbi:hypothetical protein [Paenibacillus piri]|uniref:Class I SAM-dependent methyltransferase n=1 Tax=Paenibacillus piri TaxID=2547395 RepID=A0A4V2ZTN2_9BACL|nr:hypothetical protein [Paenibacillus piri]TDF97734.1 hypothetical protein E1757_14160 [Paenibacillus piri]